MFTSGTALTTAVTDLLTGIICIPMLILIARQKTEKKKEKSLWVILFALLGGASFFGFVNHGLVIESKTLTVLWYFLYAVLFETARAFLLVALCVFTDGKPIGTRISLAVLIVEIPIYIITILLDGILLFVIFGIALCVPGFVLFGIKAFRDKHKGSRILMLSLLPQVVGGVFQVIRVGEFTLVLTFDYNSIYHLCLLVSLFAFCFGARASLKEEQ